MARVSVIIPAHNPRPAALFRVLSALRLQTLPEEDWELLIVDNASVPPLPAELALTGHPQGRVLREPRLGSRQARITGIEAASGDVLVLVDDDNVLDREFLEVALRSLEENPELAALGGQIIAEYEEKPAPWTHEFESLLAIRALGDQALRTRHEGRSSNDYPWFTPYGAGLILRRDSALQANKAIEAGGLRLAGRKGGSLSGCEDCELILHACALAGRDLAYDPRLRLTHLIPAFRTRFRYLSRLAHDGAFSWGQFQRHYRLASPIAWWTVPLRCLKALLACKAWSRSGFIRWRSACGNYKGRAC